MPNTRSNKRNWISVSGHKEQENTLVEGHSVKSSKYESYRNRLVANLVPGDHIAAERRDGVYEHHGIYEGTDRGYPSVVHFQGPVTSIVKGSASMFCVFNCGYWHPEKGGPVISCIDCFSQRQKMFKMQYMLQYYLLSDQDPVWNCLKPGNVIAGYRSKKYYLEHYLDGQLYGHSSFQMDEHSRYPLGDQLRFYEMFSNRSAQHVLDEARLSGFNRSYSLGCYNCEHFAVFCKTGMRRSVQVEKSHLPIVCKDGKPVCPFRARGKPDAENGRQNLNLEEAGSAEPMQAMVEVEEQGADEEEKELLKSFEGAKRRKTG